MNQAKKIKRTTTYEIPVLSAGKLFIVDDGESNEIRLVSQPPSSDAEAVEVEHRIGANTVAELMVVLRDVLEDMDVFGLAGENKKKDDEEEGE